MGIALWIVCATVVFLSARTVKTGRGPRWMAEAFVALAAAMILGLSATALDFGGWQEPDWRAGLFVVFGTAAAIGLVRLTIVLRQRNPAEENLPIPPAPGNGLRPPSR